MKTLKQQQGVTGIGWLIILDLDEFFVFIGLRLVPISKEHSNVVNSLKSLEQEPPAKKRAQADEQTPL